MFLVVVITGILSFPIKEKVFRDRFSVGFTSYNFGALVRYKIPCLPFYALVLAVIYDKIKREQLLKAAEN